MTFRFNELSRVLCRGTSSTPSEVSPLNSSSFQALKKFACNTQLILLNLLQSAWTTSNSQNSKSQNLFKDLLDDSREKHCMFASSVKPFDLSEATKLSLVLSASQQISQQQLKDSFMKNFGRYSTSDFDDTDSRFSFSSSSSPVHVSKFFQFEAENNFLNIFRMVTTIAIQSTRQLSFSIKLLKKSKSHSMPVHWAFKWFRHQAAISSLSQILHWLWAQLSQTRSQTSNVKWSHRISDGLKVGVRSLDTFDQIKEFQISEIQLKPLTF